MPETVTLKIGDHVVYRSGHMVVPEFVIAKVLWTADEGGFEILVGNARAIRKGQIVPRGKALVRRDAVIAIGQPKDLRKYMLSVAVQLQRLDDANRRRWAASKDKQRAIWERSIKRMQAAGLAVLSPAGDRE